MKRKSQNTERGETENRAQLILIGGLVIAVAVIAIALVIGGGLFSQSTLDDGGLSSFSSQTSDQVQTISRVGEENVEYTNLNSTLLEGMYPDEICNELVNSTKVQQLVATQLGEGESVANIEVTSIDCDEADVNNTLKGASWMVGQTNPNYNLPSVNATSPATTEGRESVDVVLAIDATGSMGLDGFDDSVPIDEDYNDLYDPSFSPSEVNTPRTQRHKETYTTDSGRTYTRSDPFDVSCYREYDETDVEFGRGPVEAGYPDVEDGYGDTDVSNRDWCEGAFIGDDFTISTGSTGEYVYDDSVGEMVRVVNLPSSTGPPSGVPNTWTRLTDDDVNTNNPSEYCTTSGGSTADCVTRNTDFSPGGSAGVGEVVEWTTYDITVDVTSYLGSFAGNHYYEVEYFGSTYTETEDDLEYFEYKWAGPEATVENEFGTQRDVPIGSLKYIEYRWWTPDRLYLTQAGARTAVDDLLDASEPGKRDSVGLVEYTTALGGDSATLRGLNEIDSGYADTLKKDIDEIRPGSGTNIKAGIKQSVEEINAGSNPDKTDHIILMTDGQNTAGYDDPVDYVESNSDIQGTLDTGITIHAIALGEGADKDTMRELGNDPDDPPSDGIDTDRPEGTFIASEDPSDAEDIFEDVIESIQDTTSEDVTASTGEVDKVQDMRMNVSNFEGNGTYVLDFNNGSDVIWQMVVDNKFVGPGAPSPPSPHGYEVRFRSQVYDSLNQTVTVSDSEGNLSDSFGGKDDYVWLDLTGRSDSKPRLDVGSLSTTETETELGGTSPDDYIEDAWGKIEGELEDGSLNIVMDHIGPNGPDNPPNRRGEVNGTFAIEFEPKDGNFTKIEKIGSGNFTDDCSAANDTDLPARCGLEDPGNNRGAVSTTQVNEVDLLVTVESPEGILKRRVTITPGGEVDIFDP